MPNLLVEIGTEELPLASLDVIYAELAPRAEEVLRRSRLGYGQILIEATPRRIALYVESLGEKQDEQTFEVRGPSREKAYDAAGVPTPALEGFLKSKGALLKDVRVVESPKGAFVSVLKKETVRSAAAVLPGAVAEIFASLSFPKLMRWDASGFRFPRPVRWIAALLGGKVLPLRLGGVEAGRISYGHRFLAPKAFSLKQADWPLYLKVLRRAHVVLPLREREAVIRKALEGRFHQKSPDEDLIHTTAQLCEEPFLAEGGFSKTFLELPAEVLASCMKKNQKIFACYGPKGKLTNRFAAVMNGRRSGLARIRADYENVLESRLKDAAYFYQSDTREPLESKLPLLEQIVYLGKLGTLKDKTCRLEKLAEAFCGYLGRADIREELVRVARLSKIDLMTQMVFEFPDLQGVIGRDYALESGEKEQVALALSTQYLPKNLAESYEGLKKNMSPLGAIFGIMDRLDLLVGAFGTGIEPSGSQDPFALRRAGGAIVKIIRAFGFHFSLGEAVDFSAGLFGDVLSVNRALVKEKLSGFLRERVAFEIQPKSGSRYAEILAAVTASSFDDLADVFARYAALADLFERNTEAFLRAVKAVERTGNILKGAEIPSGEVREDLFREELERELYRLYRDRSAEVISKIDRREYGEATRLFGEIFGEPLHRFFAKVLVNAEESAVRQNRQALMRAVNALYAPRVADLSLLSRVD